MGGHRASAGPTKSRKNGDRKTHNNDDSRRQKPPSSTLNNGITSPAEAVTSDVSKRTTPANRSYSSPVSPTAATASTRHNRAVETSSHSGSGLSPFPKFTTAGAAGAAGGDDKPTHFGGSILRKSSSFLGYDALVKRRQRGTSQGFFEPRLPSAPKTSSSVMASRAPPSSGVVPQQQTGNMQPHQQTSQILPRRSSSPNRPAQRSKVSNAPFPAMANRHLNVASAIRAVSPAPSPSPAQPYDYQSEGQGVSHKVKPEKERSKMKLFSKPKLSRDTDPDKKDKNAGASASSSKHGAGSGGGGLSRIVNPSTTTLNDATSAPVNAMYSQNNSSTSTVVPTTDRKQSSEKERDKHKHHHFLSRPKLKMNRGDHHLPLSSAASNSVPIDPNAPQSLYSFAPSSPIASGFGKSMGALDLRHGHRARREKKKEDKQQPTVALDSGLRENEFTEWTGAGSIGPSPAVNGLSAFAGSSLDANVKETLQGFGLQNMTPEDAWDYLKAKLLILFEGEDIRIALEDLNKLVSIHVQRCVKKQTPSAPIEDLRDLFQTGFESLSHSLSSLPEDRLVANLSQTWVFTFGVVLPFLQAVFLPLDIEYKGRGSIINRRDAAKYWAPAVADLTKSNPEELDVRAIALIYFRDIVVLSRYDAVRAMFSRLNLETMNAMSTTSSRPSTSSTLEHPGYAGFNSSSSILRLRNNSFSDTSSMSAAAVSRARAASNTSSNADVYTPSLHSAQSPSQLSLQHQNPSTNNAGANQQGPQPDAPHLVTETAARNFQCVSVLISVHTDDEAQAHLEVLSKTLKHNWLGRGRTGRDRRGFVGSRGRPQLPHLMSDDERLPSLQNTA